MVAYKRDEIVSVSDISRSFSTILNSIVDKSKEKFAISKNNKLEAVILDIEEYERLKNAYDILEQKEIETLLNSRTKEDKEASHSKIINLDFGFWGRFKCCRRSLKCRNRILNSGDFRLCRFFTLQNRLIARFQIENA